MKAILMREYHQPYSEISKMKFTDAIFFISLHEMIQRKLQKELKKENAKMALV